MACKKERIILRAVLLFVFLSFFINGCGNISDGEYTASVILTGGSGRASIESPCRLTVKDGKATADLIWSSPNYDFMIVDGETYYPVNSEGNSEFLIPVELGKKMQVQADTTAMSTPHLIDYTIEITIGEAKKEKQAEDAGTLISRDVSEPPVIHGLSFEGTDENRYAKGFAIHRYSEGYKVISVDDGRDYLLVPEGKEKPEKTGDGITVLSLPPGRIYLAASGAMCHFDSIGAVDSIRFSGLERDDWYIEAAREAMDEGRLFYGGKYSSPDYEKMVMEGVDLAIESTMILHVPKVQEKLEKTGIPVFIDRSSFEEEPLGRCEWIKVYGTLTGKEKEAQAVFDTQKELVDAAADAKSTGKTAAFFYISSDHRIVTRKKNDYIAKMISMAGGSCLSPETVDGEMSNGQVTISMEAFYEYAKDADILILNSAIADAPESLAALIEEDPVFSDFRACRESAVWYTDKSIYQYTDRTGSIISDLNEVIGSGKEETEFFHKLK